MLMKLSVFIGDGEDVSAEGCNGGGEGVSAEGSLTAAEMWCLPKAL